jgi:hypothetical protein
MSLFTPQTQKRMLFTGVALNAFAVLAHSKICIEKFFPVLDQAPGVSSVLTFVAKSNMLLVSASWVTIGRSSREIRYENPPLTSA